MNVKIENKIFNKVVIVQDVSVIRFKRSINLLHHLNTTLSLLLAQ